MLRRSAAPALALLAFIAAGSAIGLPRPAIAAEASPAELAATGEAAVMTWMQALVEHDPAAISAVLAPEFQILRSDGGGYTHAEYLDHLPTLAALPTLSDVVATETGDVLVVRYNIVVDETIDGKPVERTSPRLTVLRREGDRWLVVAHANFARIGD